MITTQQTSNNIHIFTLWFKSGNFTVLHVHGADSQLGADMIARRILPKAKYDVWASDITNGKADPFHLYVNNQPYVLCYQKGTNFFYHHVECALPDSLYVPRRVPIISLLRDPKCCRCWEPLKG